MRNGLARATLAVLTVAASVAGITTAATAAPGDVFGMEILFQAEGTPVGDLEASYLLLKGDGNLDMVLRGDNFTPGTFQQLTVHKGTCAAPGTAVDEFEIDPLLRDTPSQVSPQVVDTPTPAKPHGTPGAFRFDQGSTTTAINTDDLAIFTTDYVIVVNEIGSDPADYLCGSPINVKVVGNGSSLGVLYPFNFKELNSSGADATGQATLTGNMLSIMIDYTGLEPMGPNTSHFQLLRQGALCPTGSTATEAQMGGAIEVSLTNAPRSLLPTDTLTPESYFTSVQNSPNGSLNYESTIALTSTEAAAFANSTVVIHGFDQNSDGIANGGNSPIDPGLKSDETAVAGCGQFVLTAPETPAAPTAVASGASVIVTWAAPAHDGGSDITGYTVTLSSGAELTIATGTEATFTGVVDGDYTATVVATNAVGSSTASAASDPVTVDTSVVVPGPPTGVTAEAVGQTVTIRWVAPTDIGGGPLNGYTVTLSNGARKTVTGLFAIFKDQATGSVTATVTANNAGGPSAPSAPSGPAIVRDCQDGDVDSDWDSLVVTKAEGSLFRLYCGYFLRYPDEGGFNYWKGIQAGGADLITISDQFALSDEFRNTYGALNSDQFVRLLYQNVLLRPVDDEGYAYWKDLLDTGQLSQGGTMRWVAEGLEFQRVTGTP